MNTATPSFNALFTRISPAFFVLLWSTGFIGARFGIPYAEPLTFLIWRFVIVVALMLAFALITRAPWPTRLRDYLHLSVAGILVHAGYLTGVFESLHHGLPVGVTAIIIGLQPLLTASVVGRFLGESVRPRQWAGLILGLVGVILVIGGRLAPGAVDALTPTGIAFSCLALFTITAGTLYQKRFVSALDIRSANVVQYVASGIVLLPFALIFETMHVEWTGEFIFAMVWLCLVLSLGAVSLLYRLIRAGAAARVASLFYLVPPVTAFLAFLLFGETFSPVALVGMGLTVAGVWLAIKG